MFSSLCMSDIMSSQNLSYICVAEFYLRVKLCVAVALYQHVDFFLHLLVLLQCCLLVTLIIQQHCEIQIHQRVRPGPDQEKQSVSHLQLA